MVLADAASAPCLPDAPVYGYVNQDSVSLMWRYADCEACGDNSGQTVMRGPIYGSFGVLIDEVDTLTIYTMDDKTVITVDE